MIEVSVVIVSMNRPDMLFPCLDSIKAHTSVSYETLVVAYLFSPENLSALKENYPWVTIILSSALRGFSENNNLALSKATGKYCFIVNDDTLMHEPVIDRLVSCFEHLPSNAAAISPCIRFADGSIQTCGRTRWTPLRYARHYLHLVDESKAGVCPGTSFASLRPLPQNSVPVTKQACSQSHNSAGPSRSGRILVPPSSPEGDICPTGAGRGWPEVPGHTPALDVYQTYTLNGACFLIKTDAFKKVGWFDRRYFFTPEDIALGHTLNDMGYTVWVAPEVDITHLAGGSVSSLEAAIKPARVRGSMIFYGEPLWLKCFIWWVEAFRYCILRRKAARNVMEAVFSHLTPKEIFVKFRP